MTAKLIVGNYKTVLRQIRRMEQVLRDGWTVVEHEGTPDETRTVYDMGWFVRSFIRASVPAEVLKKVGHVAVDATNINSWANFLPGVGKSDAEQEPFAARAQKVAEKDTDTIPEPDLDKHQSALRRKYPWIQFGPDGRAIYTADEDVRVGHRSANSEGAAGKFLGFDLHALVAAPTVVSNGSRNNVTLEKLPSYIVGMALAPALTPCGPIASKLALETRRELCPNIADVTGDRGYSPQRLTYARPLHRQGINVFMDYRSDVLRAPKPVTIGQTKHEVVMHAGMLLSADTPDDQLVLPAPPAALATAEKRAEWRAKWYADRAKVWGWSAKKHHGDGRVQFRSPTGAGRVASKRATAASGSFKAPYRPSSDPPTATALVEQLDTWQRLAFGTSAWARAYYSGRSAVENVFSRLKEHGALSGGTCQAFGLAANTIAVLARVVIYNLHKSDSTDDAEDDSDSDGGGVPPLRGGSPQPPDPRLEPDRASRALRAPP